MTIFNSYVKLPEGIRHVVVSSIYTLIDSWCPFFRPSTLPKHNIHLWGWPRQGQVAFAARSRVDEHVGMGQNKRPRAPNCFGASVDCNGHPIWEALWSQHLSIFCCRGMWKGPKLVESCWFWLLRKHTCVTCSVICRLLQITPHQWYRVLQEFITYLRDSACVRWSLNMFAFVFNIERAVPQNIPIATGTHRPGLVVKIVSGYGKMQGLCWVDAPMNACMKWMNAERMSVLVWTDLK